MHTHESRLTRKTLCICAVFGVKIRWIGSHAALTSQSKQSHPHSLTSSTQRFRRRPVDQSRNRALLLGWKMWTDSLPAFGIIIGAITFTGLGIQAVQRLFHNDKVRAPPLVSRNRLPSSWLTHAAVGVAAENEGRQVGSPNDPTRYSHYWECRYPKRGATLPTKRCLTRRRGP